VPEHYLEVRASNDQKSEYGRQNRQSLCADQNQNRVRMFEIFRAARSVAYCEALATVTIRLMKTPVIREQAISSQPGWLNQVEIVDQARNR
jgi:hypothetical protein